MYMRNKYVQRLYDNVSRNWQKFTTMVYEINKSRDLKKGAETTFENKSFESNTIMT